MPIDPATEEHVRQCLADFPLDASERITERKMFGGLCFLLNDRMWIGITGDQVLVRLSDDDYANGLASGRIRPMDFTGRPLRNFAYLVPEDRAPLDLLLWIKLSADFVRHQALTAPPRKPRRPRPPKFPR